MGIFFTMLIGGLSFMWGKLERTEDVFNHNITEIKDDISSLELNDAVKTEKITNIESSIKSIEEILIK